MIIRNWIVFTPIFIGLSTVAGLTAAAPIPYERLSTEENTPFLKHGKPPTKIEHKKAAQKWPNVRSCLVESERKKQKPDLRQIEWDQLYSVEDGDVCLFRIFSSLGNMDRTVEWLKFHDFNIDGPYDFGIRTNYLGKKVPHKHVNGGIQIGWGDKEIKFPTCCFKTIWIKTIAYSQTISVSWSHEEKLIDVQNSYGIK